MQGYMLRTKHAMYPKEVELIFERFKKEIRRLHKELAKEVHNVFVDIERRDTVHFRYTGSERYRLTKEGVALYSSGLVHELLKTDS